MGMNPLVGNLTIKSFKCPRARHILKNIGGKGMKKLLTVLLICCMVFTFAACGNDTTGTDDTATADVIKIGFFAPVSAASAAADGASAINSAKLAVELVNANGGINGATVELVDYDDGLDTTEAANIGEKLAYDDSITAVVSGSYSGPTKVVAPICQEAGKLMVSAYAVHPDVVNAGDLIFSQSFPGALQGTGAAMYAAETLGVKKIGIIYVDLDFGTTQVNAFKAKLAADYPDVEIVYEQGVAISDSALDAPVTAAVDAGAELIYSVNYYEQAAEVLRQVG